MKDMFDEHYDKFAGTTCADEPTTTNLTLQDIKDAYEKIDLMGPQVYLNGERICSLRSLFRPPRLSVGEYNPSSFVDCPVGGFSAIIT